MGIYTNRKLIKFSLILLRHITAERWFGRGKARGLNSSGFPRVCDLVISLLMSANDKRLDEIIIKTIK